MKNTLMLMFSLTVLSLIGCQTKNPHSPSSLKCHLKNPVTSPKTAKNALVSCSGDNNPFTAICDLSVDPTEVKKGFINPEGIYWVTNGPNEGIGFHAESTNGFVACNKQAPRTVEEPSQNSSITHLTKKGVYQIIKPRLKDRGARQEFFSDRDYYHFGYRTNLPRDINSSEWKSEEIMYFADSEGRITQVALIAKHCGLRDSLENQKRVSEQALKLFDRETPRLFGERQVIPETAFFPAKKKSWQWERITLKKSVPNVQKTRISLGMYKCDGCSGLGYRLDFFL